MADTGAKAPTTTGTPSNDWTNPTYAYTDDGNYATALDTGSTYLQSYRTFGFGIPAGATIDGIEATIKGKVSVGTYTNSVRMVGEGGSPSPAKNWTATTTETTYTLGGATDKWTSAWVAADFDDTFEYRISAEPDLETGRTLSVNCITVKVYYTEAAPAAQVAGDNKKLLLLGVG